MVPRVTLVENIGFGPEATHTVEIGDGDQPLVHSMGFPLVHPPAIVPLRSMDRLDLELSHCRIPTLQERVLRKLGRIGMRALTKGR